MTREEACIYLENISIYQVPNSDYREALEMAIETLSAEPCDDCISRKEAKEIVDHYIKYYDGQYHINESIDKLPRVQPIRAKGTWILCNGRFECSVCYCRENQVSGFCPNCGADMR